MNSLQLDTVSLYSPQSGRTSSKSLPGIVDPLLQTKTPLLTAREEYTLLAKYKETGDRRIQQKIFDSNLRLVIKLAKGYASRDKRALLPDLVQEGSIGLLEAIERFDLSRGVRLSTYAVPRIKERIIRALPSAISSIRLPAHIFESFAKISRARQKFESLDVEPNPQNLANETDLTLKTVNNILNVNHRTLSLDAHLQRNDPESISWIEMHASDAPTPESTFLNNEVKDAIRMLLMQLPERHRKIVVAYYGLEEQGPYSITEITRGMGLTYSAVCHALRRSIATLNALSSGSKLDEIICG